jgi:hypothetical protein
MLRKHTQKVLQTSQRRLLQFNVNVYTDEHPDFVAYARDLANALRDTIFVDQVSTVASHLIRTHSHSTNCTGELQPREPTDGDGTP